MCFVVFLLCLLFLFLIINHVSIKGLFGTQKNFMLLRFLCEIGLVPIIFLYNSCEIPMFQRALNIVCAVDNYDEWIDYQ